MKKNVVLVSLEGQLVGFWDARAQPIIQNRIKFERADIKFNRKS